VKTTVATALVDGHAGDVGDALVRALESQLGGADPALVMVFASTAQPLERLVPVVLARWADAVVLGSSTAGEFTERGDAKGSVSAFALAGDFRVFAQLATGLAADVESAVGRALAPLPKECEGYSERMSFMLIDPLAGNVEEATLLAAAMLGDRARIAGGAAGDDLKMQRATVSCGATVASDAIVVATVFSREPIGLGVCHRHWPISRPLEVTRAEGNVVFTLEGRPAWEVWKEHTRERALAAGIDVTGVRGADVGGFLLRFEAGLPNGVELKVRAPLSIGDDGSMSFACGIPTGALLRITESEPQAQIEAAREAARRARAQLGGRSPAGALVFDCICRNLILNERFFEGVHAIGHELGGAPLAGFETYGEIAFDVGDMSGFHNTTTVVVAFGRREPS
jgi:methyl-accepting chemotaxis protein